MKGFLAAIRFLTILPVPSFLVRGSKGLERAVVFFPVVGLLIGLGVAYLDCALAFLFPEAIGSVLVVIALVSVSGALHMDGLADTADGFFSSRPREQVLEIMRDSRSGPMAIVAVVCVLLLKIFAVLSLPRALRWHAIVLMPLAGRSAMAIVMGSFSYARSEGGLVTALQPGCSWLQALWSGAFLLGAGWLLSRWPGVLAGGVSIAATLVLGLGLFRRIRGYTGDTLGAVCELVELVPALSIIACAHGGWLP